MARLLALLLLTTATAVAAAEEPPLLVTVGEVTPSRAVVWVRSADGGKVTVIWRRAEDGPEARRDLAMSLRSDRTGKLVLGGLEPATRYRYRLERASARLEGEFVTAPAPGSAPSVRFVWSADLGSRDNCRLVTEGYPIFRALARQPADFFLFLGDTIYADHVCTGPEFVPGSGFVAKTLPQFHAKHRYNRADPGVQDYFLRTPVYAIWDDHEVRNDFSGTADPLMSVGLRAFIDYFPVQPPKEDPNRLYRSFRWGDLVEVFILDTRQYRSANSQPDGPSKTMLGAAQKRWLLDGLGGSTAVWKFVISSVSLSVPKGGAARDSWSNASPKGIPEEGETGFAVERDQILRELRLKGVRNLVFLAGDVHHAELIRHHPTPEWSFHEFIAGPLSASPGRPRPLDQALNPRSLWSLGGVKNFGEIAVDATSLTVRVIDVEGRVRHTHVIGADR
jgi:alkaline phosphatase D